MRLQLIFVVESNSKSKTDWIYIKETLDRYYNYQNSNIKLSQVYMGGKGNYRRKEAEVKQLISKFNITTISDCKNVVFYCFDCDDYEKNPNQSNFLHEVQDFCGEREYEYIWFCHDIEEVYCGNCIPDNQKNMAANEFKKKRRIVSIEETNLSQNHYKSHTSNLMNVVDKYLDRKSGV